MSIKRFGCDFPDSYERVAQMSGTELLEELNNPQHAGMLTIVKVEIELRLDGKRRKSPKR